MSTPFWANDPTILFKKEYILQLWPTQKMSFEEKMNAITRIVIATTILAFLLTKNAKFIIIMIVTIAVLFSLYKYRKQNIINALIKKKEGFAVKKNKTDNKQQSIPLKELLQRDFYPTTKRNPMGNVLLTDIMDDPDRKAAPPSFNPEVYEDINKATKQQTQMLNPTIINTNKQLYGDLYDNYEFDTQMMQRFYTTANSRVTNDQGSFQNYLYGSMYSGKEDTPEGAMMRVRDNFRYILT